MYKKGENMQVQKVKMSGITHWVLLDDDMHLIAPVCEFLEFQRKIDRADNTLRAYALDLKIYWEFLNQNHYTYKDASADVVADFIDYLRRGTAKNALLYVESSRTNRSINRILSSVRRFYCYNQLRGICCNPIPLEDVPEGGRMYHGYLVHTHTLHQTKKSVFKLKENSKKVHIVTEEEMRRFLGELPRKRDRLLFGLLYVTGARIQEALDLEVSMLPEPDEHRSVGVFRQIRSKGKRRDLYAPMFFIRELYDFVYGSRQSGNRYVFVSEKVDYEGRQLTYHSAYGIMKRTQEPLHMEFTFHDLRHTFCTRLIEQGVDIAIVQLVMGHKRLYTTKQYLHMSDSYLMDCMSRYWAKQEGGILYE